MMFDEDSPYEGALKDLAREVSGIMDALNTQHDGIQIHVNGFNRWVAKYQTRDGKVAYAFGHDLLTALRNLKENPNVE